MDDLAKGPLREPKIIFAIVMVVVAIAALQPTPTQTAGGKLSVTTSLEFGLDLQGGARATLFAENATKEQIDKAADVLRSRINALGVKDIALATLQIGDRWAIQLELAGATPEKLKDLIESQGKFEAKINRIVRLTNGQGTLTVDGRDLSVSISEIREGEEIQFQGVPFTITNITQSEVTYTATVYTGEDILQIFRDEPTHAGVVRDATGRWSFYFTVLTRGEAAERFAKVTKDLGVVGQYLSATIDLYLDDEFKTDLQISAGLRGRAETQTQISGPGDSEADARAEMRKLQAILESGALPIALQSEAGRTIPAKLGEEFFQSIIIALLVALAGVSGLIFARYKDPRIVLPIIGTSVSELLLILGAAAAMRWTIDLAAIAGVVIAIGTGVNDQIIITDEILGKFGPVAREEVSLMQKMRRAFFIVFVAAATIIAAMVPLFVVGAGSLRGFAFTTIIGVLAGVLITRPAYGKFIEHLKKE